jgi:uncharacterized protein Veg
MMQEEWKKLYPEPWEVPVRNRKAAEAAGLAVGRRVKVKKRETEEAGSRQRTGTVTELSSHVFIVEWDRVSEKGGTYREAFQYQNLFGGGTANVRLL